MDQNSSNPEIRGIIEALLFVNEKPLILEQLKNLFDGGDLKRIKEIITEIKDAYKNDKRGIQIVEVAGGYQMVSNSDYAHILKKFYKKIKHERLRGSSLETLAIVAYKQPVTRLDVEAIRGVNTSGVMDKLNERGLIRVVGRKKSAGRPLMYGTTRQFLEYFGLRSLDDLPKFEDFSKFAEEKSADMEPIEKKALGAKLEEKTDNVQSLEEKTLDIQSEEKAVDTQSRQEETLDTQAKEI